MRKMNRQGFTLVELLIVLAILGLLAFIGVPRYLTTLERAKEAADEGIIANVQSAVNVYMAETGIEDTSKVGADSGAVALQGEDKILNEGAKDASILGNAMVELQELLGAIDIGSPGFKSEAYGGKPLKIETNGKVYVLDD